jgi:hypothetical protein
MLRITMRIVGTRSVSYKNTQMINLDIMYWWSVLTTPVYGLMVTFIAIVWFCFEAVDEITCSI